MKTVRIYTHHHRESHLAAVCTLVDGEVKLEGDEALVAALKSDGVLSRRRDGTRETLYPDAGILFLEALPRFFRTFYLLASDVQDE